MKSHGILRVFGIVTFAALWLIFIAVTWADAAVLPADDGAQMTPGERGALVELAEPSGRSPASEGEVATAPKSTAEDDDYNFNWLDPEKKIYVLQNRKYLKRNRLMLSLMAGPGTSNAYRNTAGIGGRLGYFFSEWLGLEFFHTVVTNSENKTFEQLRLATSNLVPVVREIRSQSGVLINYVPWYAKINVFNSILYFDWYFSGGVGRIHSELDQRTNASVASSFLPQDFTALFLGTGHLFHLNQTVSIRLDASGAYYRAPVGGTTGEDAWFSNYLFGFGVGLKL